MADPRDHSGPSAPPPQHAAPLAHAVAALVTDLRGELAANRASFETFAASILARHLPQVCKAWSPTALMQLPRGAQLAESDYGRSTVVVHRDDAFRVEFILWGQGPEVYVHDHAEPGAFGVVQGPRVHGRFTFQPQGLIAPGVEGGRLQLEHTDWLRPGDIVPIPAAGGLIHSLFYPRSCNATLSVRRTAARETPGRFYAPPFLRLTFAPDAAVHRDHQVLRLYLDQSDDGLADDVLEAYLETQDLSGHLRLALSDWIGAFPEVFERVAARAALLAGASAPTIEATLANYQRNYLYRSLHERLTPSQSLACHLVQAGAGAADLHRLFAQHPCAGAQASLDAALHDLTDFTVVIDGRRWPLVSGEEAQQLSPR